VGKLKAGRGVHPGIGRDDKPGRGQSTDPDRKGTQPVYTRRETIPAIKVDAEENGLKEEGKALKGKERPDDSTNKFDVGWPEQTQFELDNGAGDGPDGKDDDGRPGPTTRQGHHRRIFSAQCKPFSDTQEQGQANAQHRKNDMEN